MVRTVVSLSEKDKSWLDKKAAHDHVTMTEVVRRAIKHYRKCEQLHSAAPIKKLLDDTHGVWDKGDALDYQSSIRDEWDD